MEEREIVAAAVAKLQTTLKSIFCVDCCATWKYGFHSTYSVDVPEEVAAMAAAPNCETNPDDSQELLHDPVYLDLAKVLQVIPAGSLQIFHFDQLDMRLDLTWKETIEGAPLDCTLILFIRPADDKELLEAAREMKNRRRPSPPVLQPADDPDAIRVELITDLLALAGYRASTAVVRRWAETDKRAVMDWVLLEVQAACLSSDACLAVPVCVKPLPRYF